jgi:membrane protein DedA with SNARE-associated domain
MINALVDYIVQFIDFSGYLGVFILMVMESMIFPVPSEAVMPFAGFLWADGKMSLIWIIFFSTLGSFIGSTISYYIGLYGGRPFVDRFGKYFLLNQEHLEKTEKFFQKYGNKTVFISRFIPIVRHLISLPAGFAKMNFSHFILYTVIGAGMWNTILAVAGYYLGKRWTMIKEYTIYFDYIVLALIVAFVGYFIYKRFKKRQAK